MSYYGAGDYYGAGGFGSFLRGAAKAAIGFATGGPLGAARSVVSSLQPRVQIPSGGGPVPVVQTPGVMGAIQRAVPGGATGLQVNAMGQLVRKRRKMNFANGKALGRANRRVDGFVRLAKRSLKHTNYKIVSKSAGKSRRGGGHTFIETGPGGIRA